MNIACLLAGCNSGVDAVPVVRSGEQFNQLVSEAETLSKPALQKVENGAPIDDADKESLKKARYIFLGLRDYAPSTPTAHFALGKISRALEDDATALDHFNQVITIVSSLKKRSDQETTILAESYGEISRMMVLRGQIQDAGTAADSARQLMPADPRYQVDQASVLIQAKREKEAKGLLKSILAVDPTNRRAKALQTLLGD